mmetsp:Transcript_10207/g.12456  ORF Transcript_10207/g.12456 Transcript_10207/m.12456 type:complete len:242 (+) Transcript_10207:345-1070(+)
MMLQYLKHLWTDYKPLRLQERLQPLSKCPTTSSKHARLVPTAPSDSPMSLMSILVMVWVAVISVVMVVVIVSVVELLPRAIVKSWRPSPLTCQFNAFSRRPCPGSECQFNGSTISASNSSLLPLLDPEYSAVSIRGRLMRFASFNFRATAGRPRPRLQRGMGSDALPLKTVRAVGATKDEASTSKSALLNTDPLSASSTDVFAAKDFLTLRPVSSGNSSVTKSCSPPTSSNKTTAKSSSSP